jgi:hypothetical protein
MGLGWGVVNRALAKSAREGWPEALKPVEKLGIQYKDARVWGSTEAFAGVNAWPGYTDEITEYTPQKTAILGCGPGTGGRCVVLDIATRLNLDKKVDLLTWCSTNSDAYLRKLSPHLRFIQLKGMCRGDPYDYGYAELVKNKVAGYKHSHENVKPFDDFKKSKSHP